MLVQVSIRTPSVDWQLAPSEWLMNCECSLLAEWFRECGLRADDVGIDARTKPFPDEPIAAIEFIEPELAFQCYARGGGFARIWLCLDLSGMRNPPPSPLATVHTDCFILDLTISSQQLVHAATSLERTVRPGEHVADAGSISRDTYVALVRRELGVEITPDMQDGMLEPDCSAPISELCRFLLDHHSEIGLIRRSEHLDDILFDSAELIGEHGRSVQEFKSSIAPVIEFERTNPYSAGFIDWYLEQAESARPESEADAALGRWLRTLPNVNRIALARARRSKFDE
jgi:hypothetical protein